MTITNHLTWSIERGDCCPFCGGATVLVSAPTVWQVQEGEGVVDVDEEVSGHYCRACTKLVSLSLNTFG